MTAITHRAIWSEQGERTFFLVMALAIGTTVVTAFGLFHLAGFSSFNAPWWVHVHAVSSMGWIGFCVLQSTLVFRNNLGLHRKIGWLGAGLACWMVLVGLTLGYLGLEAGRVPPIFTPASLLALNWMNILTFGGLSYAAIHHRKQTEWHRRLMLCGMICLMAPALGRILIMLGVRTHLNFVLLILAWVLVAMSFDLITRRRVHPAYYWGFGAIIFMGMAIALLPAFPPFEAFASAIVAVGS